LSSISSLRSTLTEQGERIAAVEAEADTLHDIRIEALAPKTIERTLERDPTTDLVRTVPDVPMPATQWPA